MKIVLDTNVLVSAFVSKLGYSAKIIDLISTFEEIRLISSEPILTEFKDVLSRDEVKLGLTIQFTISNLSLKQ